MFLRSNYYHKRSYHVIRHQAALSISVRSSSNGGFSASRLASSSLSTTATNTSTSTNTTTTKRIRATFPSSMMHHNYSYNYSGIDSLSSRRFPRPETRNLPMERCFTVNSTISKDDSLTDTDANSDKNTKTNTSTSTNARKTTDTKQYDDLPSCYFKKASKRSPQEWKTLATYFGSKIHVSSNHNSLSLSLFNKWLDVVEYWARQETVVGLHYGLVAFYRLAQHLQCYEPENPHEDLTRLAAEAKTALHILLKHWRELLLQQQKQQQRQQRQATSHNHQDNTKLPAETADSTTEPQDKDDEDMESLLLPTLEQMLDMVREWRHLGVPVSLVTYNNLFLKTLVDVGNSNASNSKSNHNKRNMPEQCQAVLDHMTQQVRQDLNDGYNPYHQDNNDHNSHTDNDMVRPNAETYTWLLRAWAKSERPDAVQGAMKVLQQVSELSRQGIITCHANTAMYNSILEIFCDQKTAADLQHALLIFKEMDQGQIHPDVYPDKISYRIIFFALANTLEVDNSPSACQQAIEFLKDMEFVEKQHRIVGSVDDDRDQPNLTASMYSYLVRQLTLANQPEYADQVHQMMLQMQANHPREDRFSNNYHTKRTRFLMHIRRGQIQEAEDLLIEMEQDWENDPGQAKAPKTVHYESLIDAILHGDENNNETVNKAAAWLVHLLELAKSKKLPQEQKRLLPNPELIQLVLARVAGQKQQKPPYKVLKSAPGDAENLLRLVQEVETGLDLSFPLIQHDAYGSVIHSYAARANDVGSPQRAERLLLELQRRSEQGERFLTPTIGSHYTGVINAWSKSGQRNALQNAKEIFYEAFRQYESGQQVGLPDYVFFGSIISTCARFGDLEAMEHCFDLMMEKYEKQRVNKMKPNVVILNTMLLGYLKNEMLDLERVSNLVERVRLLIDFNDKTHQLLNDLASKAKGNEEVVAQA